MFIYSLSLYLACTYIVSMFQYIISFYTQITNITNHLSLHLYIYNQDIDHPMVYAALIPIIGGVGLASLKELSFTWTALIAASLANQVCLLCYYVIYIYV